MNIDITAIKFNHDPGNINTSALTVRKNYTTDITVPEWTPGTDGEDCKAVYSIADTNGETITIEANFDCDTNCQLMIRATGGGELGTVTAKAVDLPSDNFISFSLQGTDFSQIGAAIKDISWTWQYQANDNSWVNIATTNHRIYTVVSEPKAPWSNSADSTDTDIPWTDVLDVACVWADGATDTDEVARLITQHVYQLGDNGLISYDTIAGATHYSYPYFYCTEFLEKLNGQAGRGDKVNCTDCATIVSTFTNILGCSLWQSRMGSDFALRSLRAIGTGVWAVPFNGSFSYHEVAWKNGCDVDDELYDACLELNTNIGAGAPVALLPVNMTFGPCDQQEYRYYLTTSDPDGCAICIPDPATRRRRTFQ